jgi:hypothetical protein
MLINVLQQINTKIITHTNTCKFLDIRLPAMGTIKRYSKALEYEYRVKTVALGTLKRYSIISLILYLEWYSAYFIVAAAGLTS